MKQSDLIDIAISNAFSALDEYNSNSTAFEDYDQNVADTVKEMGGNHKEICLACKLYRSRFSEYAFFRISFDWNLHDELRTKNTANQP